MEFVEIPNIIHFIFGFKEQTEEFLFCYYLAIYSAYKINNPEKIYFYYHFKPFGKWWNKLLEIPGINEKLANYISKQYKSVGKIKKVSLEELLETPELSKKQAGAIKKLW